MLVSHEPYRTYACGGIQILSSYPGPRRYASTKPSMKQPSEKRPGQVCSITSELRIADKTLSNTEADALACPGFSAPHWKRLETSSVQERTNGETRRRSRAVQAFPSVKSLERLVGAVMCEQDEIWADSRHFSEEKMSELYGERETPRQPDAEEREGLGMMARKAIEASLEPADRMETA